MATQDQTNTFTADNVGNPEPVFVNNFAHYAASSGIRRVRIKEFSKTTSYIVHEPLMTSPGIPIDIGDFYDFTKAGGGFYGCGEIAGYVEVVDVALATFSQQEMAI